MRIGQISVLEDSNVLDVNQEFMRKESYILD